MNYQELTEDLAKYSFWAIVCGTNHWIIKAPLKMEVDELEQFLGFNNPKYKIISRWSWGDGIVSGYLSGESPIYLYEDLKNHPSKVDLFPDPDNPKVIEPSYREKLHEQLRQPLTSYIERPSYIYSERSKALNKVDEAIEKQEEGLELEQTNAAKNKERVEEALRLRERLGEDQTDESLLWN